MKTRDVVILGGLALVAYYVVSKLSTASQPTYANVNPNAGLLNVPGSSGGGFQMPSASTIQGAYNSFSSLFGGGNSGDSGGFDYSQGTV